MVTATIALLLGLAIWGSTLAFRNSYIVMLPLIIGTLASLLLALVGVRAAWRGGAAEDGTRGPVVWSWLW